MIYLHTLGDALIKVGEKEVRPNSPLVFAALLYLAMERGHRVPRAALQELLFPKSDERSGAHSLRQLLYKLRRLGVPLESAKTTVAIAHDAVVSDIEQVEDKDDRESIPNGFLAFYQPGFSEPFAAWLEQCRSEKLAVIRQSLSARLASARSKGDDVATGALATALLLWDPLNEDAVFAKAELLAGQGQKERALRLLADYAADVGDISPELAKAPNALKRRIVELQPSLVRPQTPFVGRQSEVNLLFSHFSRAAAGAPTMSFIWGEAGVGKTRLRQEVGARLPIRDSRFELVHCHLHDADRPLGALLDLLPRLLRLPGAIGIEPCSLQLLDRLCGNLTSAVEINDGVPEILNAQIQRAFFDLFLALGDEMTLVLVIEDAQFLDQATFRWLLDFLGSSEGRCYFLLTSRSAPRIPKGYLLPERAFVRRIDPLTEQSSKELFEQLFDRTSSLAAKTISECISIAAGNPLFLTTLAEHLKSAGAVPDVDSTVVDLLRQRIALLEPSSLLTLRFAAGLGTLSTAHLVSQCSALSTGEHLLAIQDLGDRGLLAQVDGQLRCAHDLIGEASLFDASDAIRAAMHVRIASVLETDELMRPQPKALWMCADSWRRAGDQHKAVNAFRRCAAAAVDIGQPVFALLAYEKAQECDTTRSVDLIEATIQAAELAADHDAVIRNAERLRMAFATRGQPFPLHHQSELAEINALCQRGDGPWHLSKNLRACIVDSSADASHRLRAFRLFLISAAMQFARDESIDLFALIEGLLDKAEPFQSLNIQLLFHVLYGDLEKTAHLADSVWEMAALRGDAQMAFSGTNVGNSHFTAGRLEKALETMKAAAQRSHALGMKTLNASHCAQMADQLTVCGRIEDAHIWHSRSQKLLDQGVMVRDGVHLTNAVCLALAAGNSSLARHELSKLKSVRESEAAQSVRTILGLEVLVALAEGSLLHCTIDTDELSRVYEEGSLHVEHHICALGKYLLDVARGDPEGADLMLSTFLRERRRDRYPLRQFWARIISNPDLRDRALGVLNEREQTALA